MVTMVTARRQTKETRGAQEHNFQYPGQQTEKFYIFWRKLEIIKKGAEENNNVLVCSVKFKKKKGNFLFK
jgi:hypothetical protein